LPIGWREGAIDHELVEIFRAFDLTITYDKPEKRLHLAATVTSELLPDVANASDRPEGRSQINDIAEAGLIHKPATADPPILRAFAHRIEESWPLA